MFAIKSECGFCGSKGAAFEIVFENPSPADTCQWNCVGKCGVCAELMLFVISADSDHVPPSKNLTLLLDRGRVRTIRAIPSTNKYTIPEGIPENVKTPLIDAEESFFAGSYSAAAACYRKAIERALKAVNTEAKGMLNQRIRDLEKQGLLPKAMIELLDQVRLFGNEAMHEDDSDPTREECAAAQKFCNLFLTYAFTMPALVQAAKEDAEIKKMI